MRCRGSGKCPAIKVGSPAAPRKIWTERAARSSEHAAAISGGRPLRAPMHKPVRLQKFLLRRACMSYDAGGLPIARMMWRLLWAATSLAAAGRSTHDQIPGMEVRCA